VADLVRQNFDILTRGIEQVIQRGQVSGEIRPEADAATLALFVFNAVQGLRVLAKTFGPEDRPKLTGIIDQTLTVLT
jgi:TetR/AcrR family transcriptional repressor of nem operon